MRRMAFFFSMRRTSLFDTNQRLLRSWLSSPLRITFFLKRLKSCSCDSFGRKVTDVIDNHLLAAFLSPPVPQTTKRRPGGAGSYLVTTRARKSLPWAGRMVKLKFTAPASAGGRGGPARPQGRPALGRRPARPARAARRG